MGVFSKGNIPWNKGRTGVYSEETVRSISASLSGRSIPGEIRARISNTLKGHPVSESARKRISEAAKERTGELSPRFGKHHTIEAKEKIRAALLANHPTRGRGKEKPQKQPRCVNGWKLSEETRKRIGDARRGKTISEETLKKISFPFTDPRSPRYGQKISEETRERLRVSHLGKTGEKSGRWLGGISFLPYPVIFDRKLKAKIRERDENVCQNPSCNGRFAGRTLDVHHIDYNKNNCCDENLISLCRICHTASSTNREEWKTFYQEIIAKKRRIAM